MNDGKFLFEYDQLQQYRSGNFEPDLSKIENQSIKNIIKGMISVDQKNEVSQHSNITFNGKRIQKS